MRTLLVFILTIFLTGCGAQMRNLPVGKGHFQACSSVGGPMVKTGNITAPIPYVMGGVTYGVTDHLDVHGDLHLLAAVFKLAGLTPGVTWFPPLPSPMQNWSPSLGADLLIFSNFSQTRVFPELSTGLAYRGLDKWQPYAGVHHTFQSYRRPHYIPSYYVGTSLHISKTQLFFELDYLAADHDNRWTPAEYQGINHRGALAPKFGVAFDLPGGSR